MKGISIGMLLGLGLRAAEPSAEHQIAMQEGLTNYLQAVNDCQETTVRAVVTRDFSAVAPGMGPLFNSRLRPRAAVCSVNKVDFEVAAFVRFFLMAADDVVIGDGFFRTIQFPGGEKAGRLYATFVRREERWQILALRFHPLQFEPPYTAVEPATKHDEPGTNGWVTLFDGRSMDAFSDVGGGTVPATWILDDGMLRAVAGKSARSLRTRDTYRSFELRFEWKAPPKGNSGIKYNLFYMLDGPDGSDGVGSEYQIADDAGDPGAIKNPSERTGGLYNQIAPANARPTPLGEFNESAVIVRGRHAEHWLNGTKVVEYESGSSPPEGPLVIQHHRTDMWFRNIRVRRLD